MGEFCFIILSLPLRTSIHNGFHSIDSYSVVTLFPLALHSIITEAPIDMTHSKFLPIRSTLKHYYHNVIENTLPLLLLTPFRC